ncbi:MAG: GerMN domain-containing protein [Treponema sp.]|nr:GerMN domain-containing protein [Treponema sp.]
MIEKLNTIFRFVAAFMSSKVKRRLFFIGVLFLVAILEFLVLGLARRTFVFYTINDGVIAVEDRMLKRSRIAGTKTRESDIIRYTEEMLLGPVSPDLLPLFPRETRLKSLLYRNGVVYADFSADAALPPVEGGRTIDNFRTFNAGILRNFSYVKNVRFFIEGNAVFIDQFLQEFSDI